MDFFDGHTVVVSHDAVTDDVAGVKTLNGSSGGGDGVASGEERKSGRHTKTENCKNCSTGLMEFVFEVF